MAAPKDGWNKSKLPPNYEEVLVETITGCFYIGFINDNRKWGGLPDNCVVAAWQPLASSGNTREEE